MEKNNYKIRPAALVLVAVAISLTAVFSGCTKESDLKQQRYEPDGFQGYSNTNPNLFKPYTTMSYQESVDYIHELLTSVKGISKQTLRFKGNEVLLDLIVTKQMGEEEMTRLQTETQQLLQRHLPEYQVRVTVDK